jgi:hypothetical protein
MCVTNCAWKLAFDKIPDYLSLRNILMPALLPHIDPDGLLEFSVVYTDRALNHMSQKFQGVMRDISAILSTLPLRTRQCPMRSFKQEAVCPTSSSYLAWYAPSLISSALPSG